MDKIKNKILQKSDLMSLSANEIVRGNSIIKKSLMLSIEESS